LCPCPGRITFLQRVSLTKAVATLPINNVWFLFDSPQRDIIHECILAMVNHLYWCNINIVNTVTDCLVLVAHIYRESLDPDGVSRGISLWDLQLLTVLLVTLLIGHRARGAYQNHWCFECTFEVLWKQSQEWSW
jgi:hypothetical protein